MNKPKELKVGQIWGNVPFLVVKIINDREVIMRLISNKNENVLEIARVLNWAFKGYDIKFLLYGLLNEKNND